MDIIIHMSKIMNTNMCSISDIGKLFL